MVLYSLVMPVFKQTDLVNLYSNRLEQLETHATGRIYSTKLKNRIMSYFPDSDAHKEGRGVILVHNKDVGDALGKAYEHDSDNDAVHLLRSANIVRRDMFKMKHLIMTVRRNQCQSLGTSFYGIVWFKHHNPVQRCHYPSTSITISQLLMYNSVVHKRETVSISPPITRHSQVRTTTLPIYVDIKIRNQTHK